jgi:ferritin-like metal-binding protein YciE
MNSTKGKNQENGKAMKKSQLMQLFENELKDIYWAEKELVKAIPKMIDKATSPELIDALHFHLNETEEHVERLEEIFEAIDVKPVAEKCEATAGLLKEAAEIMDECEEGAMRDAGIISAAQKVEHYEIATYGTLRQFAETLDLEDVISLLESTLEEEKAADATLTKVAISAINMEAAEEEVTT